MSGDLLMLVWLLWGKVMDRYGESLAVGLDKSKAFDMVWYKYHLSEIRVLSIALGFATSYTFA